ncbi:winged helix-turn-helix domain-containing protein [Pararhodobacter sp. SW119]|uniref:winged helix-turn-helix domain-containing tetratricopeptide repeat protein n=1 Tax=Pararhodobacter sp. SW119 TaxID=2780075 RepID=UPI001ADFC3A1|nr:winged helix-turn-helix domain-containing protein [Pararhodobacter sp. SW119]
MPQTMTTFACFEIPRRMLERPVPDEGSDRHLIEGIARRHGAGGTRWADGGAQIAFATGTGAIRCAFDLLAVLPVATGHGGIRGGIDMPVDPDARDEGAAVAQALARCAEPGEVLISATARAAISPMPGVAFDPRGPVEAAPMPLPIEAFRARRIEVAPATACLRFGDFTVDPLRRELRREGEPVPLEPLTFDLLLLLVQNRDRVVARDEIFASLWDGRIVSDTALSSQVKALRQALGDSGRAQHTIGTVHGRGFRFLRAVTPVAAEAAPARPEPPQASARPLIGVLPFENLSGDASGRVFADGITEDILNALSRHRWIGVVARNPAFAFRDTLEPLDAIAGQLGATHVVTGSLRKAGERVRIGAEAVEVHAMRRLWSDTFEIDIAQVFEFQDEICGTLAARLATELGVSEQQKARALPRANRGAWELYHLGMAEFYKFTAESNRRAQEFLRMAIRAEPDFAEPYTRLAYAITLSMVYFEGAVSAARLDDALDLALRGLALDDRDAQGHFALGRVRLARQEYDLAIDALEHSLDLNPYLAVSHCGLGDSLAYEGRIDDSIRHFERAIQLSPHDPFRWAFHSYRSLAHLFGAEFEAAARAAGRAVQVPNAHYSAHANLLAALGHTGDRRRIERARTGLMRAKPDFSLEMARGRLFYLKSRAQLGRYMEGLARAGVA